MSEKDHEHMVSMEEGRAGKCVSEQTSETSGSNVQIIEVPPIIPQGGDSPSDYVKQRFKSWDAVRSEDEKGASDEGPRRAIILRVPEEMRNNEKLNKYFEPRSVSIGPLHHEKQSKVMETMKIRRATSFIDYFEVDREQLYVLIRKEIKHLREFYEPDATKDYNDDELALMFLLDGCVVMMLISVFEIYCSDYYKNLYGVELLTIDEDLGTAMMDLYLLENQLPYKVLDIVMTSCEETEKLRDSIKKFIFHSAHLIIKEELSMKEPIHLLDLLWRSFNRHGDETHKKSSLMARIKKMPWPRDCIGIIRMLLFPLVWFVRHILVAIVLRIIYVIHAILKPHSGIRQGIASYTIEELKFAGIELMPTETDHFTNIRFSNGKLKLPPIAVTKSTPYMLFNLAAYEMIRCDIEASVGPFIVFLSTLISKDEDVKELRDSKILYNYLDSSKELLELLNIEFKTPALVIPDLKSQSKEKYLEEYDEIQKFCNNRVNVWMAEFKREYFRSPWTVIALFGVIVGILLTVNQSYEAFVNKNK